MAGMTPANVNTQVAKQNRPLSGDGQVKKLLKELSDAHGTIVELTQTV